MSMNSTTVLCLDLHFTIAYVMSLATHTETGHNNYIDLGDVSEEANGKYTLQIFAEFFHMYELVDQALPGMEGLFGLLRNNLTEKPAFRAIKYLISVLNDKGPNFFPNTLTYTLTGNLTNVRQLIFQKRNGEFYLMIWNEVSSWDVSRKFDLYPLPQQLHLNLQGGYILSDATLYTFNNNADLQTINLPINNNQIIFNAKTDRISIIRLNNGTNSNSGSTTVRTTSTAAAAGIGGIYRITPKYAPIEAVFVHTQCFELLLNGYYHLTPKNALNQWIDIPMCTTIVGVLVQQWSWSNSECQQGKLENIE
ncbi:hypothetical protein I4U23_022109 [Adineta vaga]|nr:hypothetical protein I4U23_022109 [Adineta vaga]